MAITATVSVDPQVAPLGSRVAVTLTVSNSGSSTTVTSVTPCVTEVGGTQQTIPCLLGSPPIGAGLNVTVPASSSLVLKYDLVVLEVPRTLNARTLAPVSVGATVLTADGSRTLATAATLNVGTPSTSSTYGALLFNVPQQSGLYAAHF